MTHGLKAVFRLMVLTAAATSLYAEKYALIAGVGQFVYLGDKNSLAGARPDAEKMVATLSKYGFPRDKMTVLIGKEGTREAFLDGIDHIADLVQNGDQVVIYFSGHGTSSMDNNGGFGMDADTGAVIPSDLKPANTKEEVLAQLILGKRDLQPRLSRLEQKASVLVIFDACFSGESVKGISVGSQSKKRYISLADLTNGDVSSKSILAAERSSSRAARDYPYKRVVYFSAASKSQPAWDIAPHGDFSTFDGLPHGAFTNVFLKLLSDGEGSSEGCRTLYDKAVKLVHEQAAVLKVDQDPQLLYSSSDSAQVDRPCLAPNTQTHEEPPPAPTQPTPANDIRAQMDRVAAAAAFRLQCAPSKPSYRAGGTRMLATCRKADTCRSSVMAWVIRMLLWCSLMRGIQRTR